MPNASQDTVQDYLTGTLQERKHTMLPILHSLNARITFLETHGNGAAQDSKKLLQGLSYDMLLDISTKSEEEYNTYYLPVYRKNQTEIKNMVKRREAWLDGEGQKTLICNITTLEIRNDPARAFFESNGATQKTINLQQFESVLPGLKNVFNTAENLNIEYDAFQIKSDVSEIEITEEKHILFAIKHDYLYKTEIKIEINPTKSTWTVFLHEDINIPILNLLALKAIFQDCQTLHADDNEELIAETMQRKYTKKYQRILYDDKLRLVRKKINAFRKLKYYQDLPEDVKRKIDDEVMKKELW